MMKKAMRIIGLLVLVLSLIGCGSNEDLRYQKCVFIRESYYENWVVKSMEGVTAEIKEASPEKLVVELSNALEHEVQFTSWSRAFVYRDGVWYTVLPKEDIATPSGVAETTPEEEAARTIHPGESKEFTYDFPASYQGAVLPAGDYRMHMFLKYPSPEANDPSGLKSGDVWIDFVIE